MKILYIDNFAAIGTSPEACEDLLVAMEETFCRAGIVVARDAAAKGEGTLLGFKLDVQSGLWRPTAKRYSKVVGALDYILAKGRLASVVALLPWR